MDYPKSAAHVRGQRLAAAIIDFILFQLIVYIVSPLLLISLKLDAFMYHPFAFFYEYEVLFRIISSLMGIVIGIWYYGITPAKHNGQTRGKKMFHVKAVDEQGWPPSLATHLKRAIMLYGLYVNAPLLLLIQIDYNTYTDAYLLLFAVTRIFIPVSLVSVLTRSNARGLHDMIAKTYVVDERFSSYGEEAGPTKKKDSTAFNDDASEDKDPWS